MLTVCLITQGRTQLTEFLESIESIYCLDYVQVLIIDNGCPVAQSTKLQSWANAHEKSVYVRCTNNTTDWNELWDLFHPHLKEWVVFPGDDDRLIPEGIAEWKRIVTANPEVDAVAMSARIIKADGTRTQDIVGPDYSRFGTGVLAASRALHSPPFFWPSLFVQSYRMAPPFPISRYVLDWMFGIDLVMNGKIITSAIASIEYRRHETQESKLASSNRKMFEGVYWLSDFINSEEFAIWVESQSTKDIAQFWNSVLEFPPIYGEGDLSNILIFRIAAIIQSTKHGLSLQNQILVDLSMRVGALQHDESIREILGFSKDNLNTFGNLIIENDMSVCPIIGGLVSSLNGAKNALRVKIFCEHTEKHLGIRVTCASYLNLNRKQALDALVRDISLDLESRGELAFRISPLERKFVIGLRRYKRFVPMSLMRAIRRAND